MSQLLLLLRLSFMFPEKRRGLKFWVVTSSSFLGRDGIIWESCMLWGDKEGILGHPFALPAPRPYISVSQPPSSFLYFTSEMSLETSWADVQWNVNSSWLSYYPFFLIKRGNVFSLLAECFFRSWGGQLSPGNAAIHFTLRGDLRDDFPQTSRPWRSRK